MSAEFDLAAWLAEPSVNTKTKSKKGAVLKQIKFQIFADCAKLTSDAWWANILHECSLGKMPNQYFDFDGRTLSYRKGKSSKRAEVYLDDDPNKALHQIIGMIRVCAHMFSPTDAITQQNVAPQPTIVLNWHTCSVATRAIMVDRYVEALKEQMALDLDLARSLRGTIVAGISGGYIDERNVHIVENYIYQIYGLYFDDVDRVFFLDAGIERRVTKSTSHAASAAKIVDYEATWRQTNKHLEKQWRKYAGPPRGAASAYPGSPTSNSSGDGAESPGSAAR